MKTVKLLVVTSTTSYKQLSLRGPEGRKDGVHEHLTNSDFKEGDTVYLISEEDFEILQTAKRIINGVRHGN